jgi:4-amino-4-deoxy-L-arabinose transferase-like glycosyltransferase
MAGAGGPTAATGGARGWALAALAAGAIGVVLRAAGLDSGLPFVYDPDEPDFVNRAFRMLATGDLDPGWFGHPGTTTMYAFLLAFAAYGRALGGGVAELGAAFRADPSGWFLVARCVVLAFAAGTLALTWRLARRVAGPAAALLAVGLLAVAPLHVQFSRIARPDVQMTFFVVAALLCALGIVERGRWRDYLATGFCLGLAAVTKYPALVFALPVVLAHALGEAGRGGRPWHRLPRLAGAGGATLAGAFVGSPWLFFSAGVALRDVMGEARGYHLGATSEGFLPSLGWYLGGPLLAELGILAAALALAGAWAAVRRRDGRALVVAAAPVAFVLAISALTLRWERWVLPAVPFACVLAGLGLDEVRRALAALGGRRLAAAGAVAVAAVAVLGPALNSVPWTVAAARGDTRDFAWRWLDAHVAPGSRILVEAYAPQLEPARYALYVAEAGRVWRLDPGGRRYAVPKGIIGTLAGADAVARAGIEYVVIANHYDRRLAEPARYAREIAVYEELMRRSELVFEATPAEWVAVGLPVRVYRVRR